MLSELLLIIKPFRLKRKTILAFVLVADGGFDSDQIETTF